MPVFLIFSPVFGEGGKFPPSHLDIQLSINRMTGVSISFYEYYKVNSHQIKGWKL